MDIEKEPVIIDIPLLEEGEKKQERRKLSPRIIPTAIAALLIAFSLVIHSAIAAKACEYFKSEGSELLLSFLISDYKKSEPMVPPLPEQSEIKREPEDKHYDFSVRESDLSTKAEYGLALTNETAYTPDLYQLLGSDRPAAPLEELDRKYGKSSPKVLIYHSHATEGYADSYGTSFRTRDPKRNVVAVGEIITKVLEKAGIATIHVTELFDGESWSAAYDNSTAAVRAILERYPSISFVFDVHRDCIGNEHDGYVRSSATVFGKSVSQLMFVCGTDEGGSSHTEWRQNLTTALQIQSEIFSDCQSLMRPVNLRRASFFQDTTPASLILECGTCANTLDESLRSGVIFAKYLADYIKGADCGLDAAHLIDTLCP